MPVHIWHLANKEAVGPNNVTPLVNFGRVQPGEEIFVHNKNLPTKLNPCTVHKRGDTVGTFTPAFGSRSQGWVT